MRNLHVLALLFVSALAAPAQSSASAAGFFNVSGLATIKNSETRSISAEIPRGERGAGATEAPLPTSAGSGLGTGWKILPCIALEKGETVTLAGVEGPGVIQHIWVTVVPEVYRETIPRLYWDQETR